MADVADGRGDGAGGAQVDGLVVDLGTATVTATIAVGDNPWGITISPDGSTLYVANTGSGSVSVIDSGTNSVTETIVVGRNPIYPALNPSGTELYTSNAGDGTVSVTPL